MPDENFAWADLSAAGDPALVAWLEDASCGPHVKALVVRAVHASERGVSAAQWRRELLAPCGVGPAGGGRAVHAQCGTMALARHRQHGSRGVTRPRVLGLAVDLGGTRAVARPLGRHLSGVPAQLVTRGYHLYALPSPRARARTAADWLMHAALGDDFTRLGLPDRCRARSPAGNQPGSTCPATMHGRRRRGSSRTTREGG